MRLVIATERDEGDDAHWNHEHRLEVELPWDADGDAYVQAMASFMFARTFTHDVIVEAMRGYVEQYDDEEPEDWTREAEADEKTAPLQDD